MRAVTPLEQYLEHFDKYLELELVRMNLPSDNLTIFSLKIDFAT